MSRVGVDVATALANKIRRLTEELNVVLAMASRAGVSAVLFTVVRPLPNLSPVLGIPRVLYGAPDATSEAEPDESAAGPTYTAYEFEMRIEV